MKDACSPPEGEFRLIRRFRDIGHKLKRLGDVNLEEKGITFSQLRVLGYLMRHGEEGALQRDLEEAFGIRRSSVTAILQNMEKADLVRRDSVSGDARKKRIRVTEKGKQLDGELRAYMDSLEEELTAVYTPEELVLLSEWTERLLYKLKTMEGERA